MKCPNCGKKVPDNALFCMSCGRKIDITASDDTTSSIKEDRINDHSSKKRSQGKRILPIILTVVGVVVVAGVVALLAVLFQTPISNQSNESFYRGDSSTQVIEHDKSDVQTNPKDALTSHSQGGTTPIGEPTISNFFEEPEPSKDTASAKPDGPAIESIPDNTVVSEPDVLLSEPEPDESSSYEPDVSPSESIPDDTFSITREEIKAQVAMIKECFYHPGENDDKVSLKRGTDGWDYSRNYYYHNGEFVFVFIFKGDDEPHRLYFKDGHMIRYVDENRVTYDYGNLDAFKDWETRALQEAARYNPNS